MEIDFDDDEYYEIKDIVEADLKANLHVLPKRRVNDIRHYLDYGQLQMAFEYLYSEIMERKDAVCTISYQELFQLTEKFELQKNENTRVNGMFWEDLNNYINGRKLDR